MVKKQLLVNLPLALHARLKGRAYQEGRTMTSIVIEALEDRLDMPYEPSFQEALADELEALFSTEGAA